MRNCIDCRINVYYQSILQIVRNRYIKRFGWPLRSIPFSNCIGWFLFNGISSIFHLQDLCRTWLLITWRMSYRKQELLTIREHMGSPSIFHRIRVAHLFMFLCFVLFCFVSVLCLVHNVACLTVLSILDLLISYNMFNIHWNIKLEFISRIRSAGLRPIGPGA